MQGVRRLLWRTVALACALMLLAAACVQDGDGRAGGEAVGGCPPGGVAVGFFGALSGQDAQLGINLHNGVRLAIDQYNANRPPCRVESVEFDSQGSETQAPGLAQEAIQNQRVVAIVGPAYSAESKNANPIFNEAGMPLVTIATNAALAQNGWTIFHRVVGNDRVQGSALARLIKERLLGKKVAVVDDKSEYGKGIADIVRDGLGGLVAFNDSIDVAGQDYSSTVNGVRSSAADVIFYGGYYAAAGRLLKQLRDAGVTATFVSDDAAKDPQLIQIAGQAAAEGVLLTCPCAPIENVRDGERFRSAYEEAFQTEPGTYSAEGYDAANVILEAIKAGKTDRRSINDFLKTVDYQGITKRIAFDATGEVADQRIFVYQVSGGAITAVGLVE
ncbi:MAG: branched-chain amino acid ABC transporter substrate-binding protein [Egibacteraceae bacterium]